MFKLTHLIILLLIVFIAHCITKKEGFKPIPKSLQQRQFEEQQRRAEINRIQAENNRRVAEQIRRDEAQRIAEEQRRAENEPALLKGKSSKRNTGYVSYGGKK
jgi:hypothetical protein